MAILKVANIHFDAAGTTVIRANGANTLTFNTAGNEDARIDASGNVLIGRIDSTVGQSVKLDVAGGINASAVLINGAPALTGGITSNVVISVADNTNAALRITQTGLGHALLVEDSANPDATLFKIDANGKVGIGTSSTTSTYKLSVLTGTSGPEGIGINGSFGVIALHPSANSGDYNSIVSANDQTIIFWGAGGPNSGNLILAPYSTTTSGVKIDQSGNVFIGRINSTVGQGVKLDVDGAINASAVLVNGVSLFASTNVYTQTVGAASNTYAQSVGTAGNTISVAAFATANAALPNTSGVSFNGTLIFPSGNLLINRTDSTVGQGVKLDVAGAVNASALLINGTAISAVSGGDFVMQAYVSPATWTKPAGLKGVKVTVVGGGGGTTPNPTGTRGGAGGGGTAVQYIDAPTIPGPVAVTVGAAGSAAGTGTGGTSSFGAFCSATGGSTGSTAPAGPAQGTAAGGAGGAGTGGTYNLTGGSGGTTRISGVPVPSPSTGFAHTGAGGYSIFNGGGAHDARLGAAGAVTVPSNAGGAYGGGASGVSLTTGADGGAGIVIVEEFY